MNNIYKVIWSAVRNCYVVTSELAKSHSRGKTKRTMLVLAVGGILSTIVGTVALAAPATNPPGEGPGIAVGAGSRATGSDGSVAVGVDAKANAEDAIAIGDNANASLLYALALGRSASVYAEGGAGISGIAIGTNARSHVMTNANHEAIITFGRDKNTLPGGIAIGSDTHARIGNVELGNRDYRSLIGDFDLAGKDNREITSGVGTTAIGDNSYAMGNFQSINGAFNVISKAEDLSTASWAGSIYQRGMNALHNAGAAAQGFGAIINGTLNSIEGNEELSANLLAVLGGTDHPATGFMYSGMANTIVGMANRTNKSNGTLIFGYGNEVTNSYLTPTAPVIMDSMSTSVPIFGTLTLNPTVMTDSILTLSTTLREYMQDNRLSSVSVTGGANKVDYAIFSSVSGVGNELSGKGSRNFSTSDTSLSRASGSNSVFAAFNSIQGYENKGTRVTHTALTGSWNELENTVDTVIIGNNHILKGSDTTLATGNIIIGFNGNKDESAIKASAQDVLALGNDTRVTGDRGIAIGKATASNGTNSIAIGTQSKAEAENSVALGSNAVANIADGVALGSKSVASVDKGKIGYDADTEADHSNDTTGVWKSTAAAVSVGDVENAITRQITGVAAGTEDSDAVNVAQLKSVLAKTETEVAAAKTEVAGGKKVSITTSTGADGHTIYAVDALTSEVVGGKKVSIETSTGADGHTIYAVDALTSEVVGGKKVSVETSTGADGHTIYAIDALTSEVVGGTNVTVNTSAASDGHMVYTINAIGGGGGTTVTGGNVSYAENGSGTLTLENSDGSKVEIKDLKNNYTTSASLKDNTLTFTRNDGGQYSVSGIASTEDIKNAVTRVDRIDRRVNSLDHRLDKVGAHAAALAALHPLDDWEKLSFAAGVGSYHKEQACALGAFYRFDDRTRISVGGSTGNGEYMLNVGFTLALDRDVKSPYSSRRAMVAEINQLKADENAKDQRIAVLEANNEELTKEVAQLKAMVLELLPKNK